MTTNRTSNHLRLHRDEPPHREEARRMMQAVLDGEIAEDSPRLQELLRLDPVLEAEFDDLRRLELLLTQRPAAVDLTDRVLTQLRVHQVGRSQQATRSLARRLSPFLGGLAASIAIGSLLAWTFVGRAGNPIPSTMATLASLPAGAPLISPEERLVEDARQAIQQTTGRVHHGRDTWGLALGQPNDLADQVDQATRRAVAERAALASAPVVVSGAGRDVALSRAGISFVNPGPVQTPVANLANDPMLGRTTAVSADWQPGATRRRENLRFMVSGWYDSDGNNVPIGSAAPKRR